MMMGLMQRSFHGGVLILAVITVRILWLDRLPKRTFPVLWSLALARLLLPFSFASGLSLYTLLRTAQSRTMPNQHAGGMWEGVTFTGNPPAWAMMQDLALGQEPEALTSGSGTGVLGAVWCAGAVAMALFFMAAYFRSLWSFRRAVPVEDGMVLQWLDKCRSGRWGRVRRISVRRSDAAQAPLTYGCLRPVILLPGRALEVSGRELEYILQHEFVHICHWDAAMKLVMVAALCIHWFNPLVWVLCRLMNQDMELACDEGVLRRFGREARAGYAMTLIGMEEKKRILLPLYNGFSKNAIEERVSLIMKYKKIKGAAVMASLMLVVCIALVFATSTRTAEARSDSAQDSDSGAGADGLPVDPPLDRPGDTGHEEIGTDVQSGFGEGAGTQVPQEEGPVSAQAAPGGNFEEDARQGQEFTLRYMQEGLPQEEPAYLYRGSGFCLLVPVEGRWRADGSGGWVWESNNQARFWVADYSGNTWEQAQALLEDDGYSRTETDGVLRKEDGGIALAVRLDGNGGRIMGIHYARPADSEYEEGLGAILSAIAANFVILPEEGQMLPEDRQQLEQLALAFWEAYLAGGQADLEQYLATGYTGDVETFPDGQEGHVAAQAQLLAVKGLDIGEAAVGDQVEIWAEFRPWAEADYLEYLTISAVKEADGWKVGSYGLER